MNKESIMRVHRIYNIVFSVVLVIAGICLIAGCLSIYFSGGHPFSREVVASTFSGIAIPVYLALAMTIINIVWGVISPTDEKKKPIQKKARAVKNAGSKEDASEETDFDAGEKKYRPYRNAILIAAIIFIVAGLLNEGTVAVLAKAINICTECIGLG